MNAAMLVNFLLGFSCALAVLFYIRCFRFAFYQLHIVGIVYCISAVTYFLPITFQKGGPIIELCSIISSTAQFILLCWFYYQILIHSSYRKLVFVGFAGYLIVHSFILLSAQAGEVIKLPGIVASCVILLFGVAYFHQLVSTLPASNLYVFPLIWINGGLMFYAAFRLFLWMTTKYLLPVMEPSLFNLIDGFTMVNEIISNMLFVYGLHLFRLTQVQKENRDSHTRTYTVFY